MGIDVEAPIGVYAMFSMDTLVQFLSFHLWECDQLLSITTLV